MIFLLNLIGKLSICAVFLGAIFSSVSDLTMGTTYLADLDDFIDLSDARVGLLLGILSLIYLIVFLLSYINRWTKYSQTRKLKNKNSEIEITIKTINDISKEFLGYKPIIKNVKVKSYPKGKSAVVIEGFVDTYNMEDLSENLQKIQEELAEHVEKMTGVQVKKSTLKVKKILSEQHPEIKTQEAKTVVEENAVQIQELEEEN